MSFLAIGGSHAQDFLRLLKDYRKNVNVEYRMLIMDNAMFKKHRTLHLKLQGVRMKIHPIAFVISLSLNKQSTQMMYTGI